MKIHANFKLFAATKFDAKAYIASPSFGVNRFMLDRIGDEKARATTIVEYKPNSKFPEHTHIGGEEFLVLEGTFKDQHGDFGAGTYVRNPVGSKHAPWVDEDGCVIMVKLLQMSSSDHLTAPLYVNLETAKETAITLDYGKAANLYENEQTGERVEMCWVEPNKFIGAASGREGGEEIFVMDGSVLCGVDDEYPRWGWLRFPPGEEMGDERKTLKSGEHGAQIYRKTGHLTEKALSMEKIQIAEDETIKVN